jgi:hypothetical protein
MGFCGMFMFPRNFKNFQDGGLVNFHLAEHGPIPTQAMDQPYYIKASLNIFGTAATPCAFILEGIGVQTPDC